MCVLYLLISPRSPVHVTRSDIFFNFSAPFEIHDDTEILRRMGLHEASHDELLAGNLVPPELVPFLKVRARAREREREREHARERERERARGLWCVAQEASEPPLHIMDGKSCAAFVPK